jgi:hypothetical protein
MLAVHQNRVDENGRWANPLALAEAQLCLVFCSRTEPLPELAAHVQRAFPLAKVVGATTAGQIAGTALVDGAAVVTAVRFATSTVAVCSANTAQLGPFGAGVALAKGLSRPGLRMAMVFCEGIRMNGSELARGLAEHVDPSVLIAGGLAADGTLFEQTAVYDGTEWSADTAVGVGLYGDDLLVGQGSMGGWDPFGPDRLVTRSMGNTVYSLDDEPALDLYIRYLGPHASGLPGSALRFPLSLRLPDSSSVVRTVLSVDEEARSLTYAGDVPQGGYARLMRANLDRLVDGAMGAAEAAHVDHADAQTLALLVSCVGRRIVLGPRTEEELEVVAEALRPGTVLAGFYSYGELGRVGAHGPCRLLNQTMSIATVCES